MTRKDFVLIAAAFKSAMETEHHTGGRHIPGIDLSARYIATALAQSNQRFDRERFLKACGVQS